MSERARQLFDKYVASSLNHPDLKGLSMGTHLFNLNMAASEARIPASEMIEELGPLAQALIAAKIA
ncbi:MULTISPECIES: hypothetical protein [unclassified Mesorhizobium]|uniref:hypothetical protein n=1 Tax=Mesorhizobium TaxID=68287 RepID=UPI000FCBDB2F|nr:MULTISPECIES: hypothetical protein [unclassified Mesorhizobium]RVD67392.1 hypothetical protein EN751_37055 [Mesorhizobium sp. M4A.F.Ca.ET.029.04.2.1]RUW27468.1 hypothetical protein EOA34_04635 [Mesorhizobium sp. M4B.F.Ca.ET.013.02.1.1]RUW78620.1 hypothetical protein EOA31_01010 [Mesorhizobium sp. M4B.F.Ca.ET.049.02.1.2]RVD31318.1 hypothetical protein EN738_02330 [Mesorhizobium sp. M4B.F.Ca.ET.017.02.2.1]RVD45873.1 hypothetical protein EN741_03635 [Mesorhizobium sp. M4B.F.Ca.ET.019.03.1.1]